MCECRRKSGRRDLNSRPVAAAAVLQIQLGKFVAASARLEIQLPSHGFGSSREAFALYEKPWDSVARGFGMTGIIPMYSIVKVLTRANIKSACFHAPKNINMKHARWIWKIGPAGFEPTTS